MFELKIRAALFDNGTRAFETHGAETVADLIEHVKGDFQWVLDVLEKNCFTVQLLMKGKQDYYEENTTMAQVRMDSGEKGVTVEMLITKEESSAAEDDYEGYDFCVFNKLVKICVQGNKTVDVVKDLIEKMKPVLVVLGLKSYGHIKLSQRGSYLPYEMPLYEVPAVDVIDIQQVGQPFTRVMDGKLLKSLMEGTMDA